MIVLDKYILKETTFIMGCLETVHLVHYLTSANKISLKFNMMLDTLSFLKSMYACVYACVYVFNETVPKALVLPLSSPDSLGQTDFSYIITIL